MVVALGPGKFYGSGLPRPRFYTDVKHSDHRVDPPSSVMDPLLAWANEAHWSMGGLSFKRHRLQGRIEGNVEKLRVQREETFKRSPDLKRSVKKSVASLRDEEEVDGTPSPPPAPVAIKRRRVVGLLDEDVEEEVVVSKRGTVRRLGDDFERVARESGMKSNSGGGSPGSAAAKTRSKSSEEEETKGGKKKVVKEKRRIGSSVVAAAAGIRSSPRLSKRP